MDLDFLLLHTFCHISNGMTNRPANDANARPLLVCNQQDKRKRNSEKSGSNCNIRQSADLLGAILKVLNMLFDCLIQGGRSGGLQQSTAAHQDFNLYEIPAFALPSSAHR